jgi:hypothetical protein
MNPLGNLSFFTTDPDGHKNEWVQYLPNSVTSNSLGQYMPGTQLFGYLEDYGIASNNNAASAAYYAKCGLGNDPLKVYLPNNNCYLEELAAPTGQGPAGVHTKAQLVNFRGQAINPTTTALLNARDPSIKQTTGQEGGGSFPMHWYVDVFTADGSRVRGIDINY